MTRMMKDSGVEWIGEIPTDWERTSLLNNLRTFITDGPHETPKLVDSGIPFISVDSLNDSEDIDLSVVKKFISEEDYNLYQKKTHLEKGDILFSKSATIGKTAILKNEKCMVWSPLAVIKPNNERCLTKYLYYILSCENAIKYASLQGSYNTQVNLGMRTLEKIYIPVPPLSEQQKIAAFLDEKCGAIDEIISKTEQSIEEYKKLKQSVITKAVTKGIRPNRLMKDCNIGWIGEIPEDWDIRKLANIFHTVTDYVASGSFGDLAKNVKYLDSPDYAQLIRTTDVSGKGFNQKPVYIDEASYNYLKNSNLFGGEIILPNIGASVGDVYIVPKLYERMSLAPNSVMLKTNQNTKYFYYFFASKSGREALLSIAESTAQPKFSKTELRQMKIPLPTEQDQKEIAEYLDEKCAEIDALIEKKQQFLSEMANYKKSLIYEYVTGKKEVA